MNLIVWQNLIRKSFKATRVRLYNVEASKLKLKVLILILMKIIINIIIKILKMKND
jgi:hypothetical protein